MKNRTQSLQPNRMRPLRIPNRKFLLLRRITRLPWSRTWCRNRRSLCCLQDDQGAATLEVVIIIAVLLAIALIFNSELRSFAQAIFDKVFDEQSVLSQI